MKSRQKYISILLIVFGISFNSCQEDFLERYPLDEMTDATFFTSANDLKVMVNGFYRLFPRYHFQQGGMLIIYTLMLIPIYRLLPDHRVHCCKKEVVDRHQRLTEPGMVILPG